MAGKKSLSANLKLISGATLLGADFHADGTKVVSSASVKLPAFAPTLFPHSPVEVGSQVERAMDNSKSPWCSTTPARCPGPRSEP